MSRKMRFFLLVPSPLLAFLLARLGWVSKQDNLMGWILFLVGVCFMVGLPFFILRTRKTPPATQEEKGDRSFWLILPGFLFIFFGPPLEFLYLPKVLPRNSGMEISGIMLLVCGMALRVWMRLSIQELYSSHVEVTKSHRLVQSGPYHFIRHPGYTGFLLIALGIAFGYSSLIGLVAIPGLMLPGLVYRLLVEEKLLESRFGTEYRQYKQRTYRLFPGLW